MTVFTSRPPRFRCGVCTWQSLKQYVAVLHRAHTSGFCSALQQLSHSVALLLSLSAAASSVLGIWCLYSPLSSVKPHEPTELPTGERREDVEHRFVHHLGLPRDWLHRDDFGTGGRDCAVFAAVEWPPEGFQGAEQKCRRMSSRCS
jgi:hypothetical protein